MNKAEACHDPTNCSAAMEIARLCLNSKKIEHDHEFLFWEGNYWDEPVHDYATLSFSTVEVLVNKVTAIFGKYCNEGEKVLLFLPQLIQLPLSILAAFKAGVTVIPLDPANCDEQRLERILSTTRPVLAITVDAYWLGQSLQETYKKLDSVLEKMEKDSPFKKILVIRHTSPNPGVPPPEEHIPARRPYYLIEWSVREGRDVEWSQEIRQIPVDVKPIERENPEEAVILPSNFSGLKADEVLKLINEFPRLNGPIFSIPHPESKLGLIAFLSCWSAGYPLVQYEGLLDYPDPARIAHIVRKYEVKSLVMHDIDLEEEYLRLVENCTLELVAASPNLKNQVEVAFPHAKTVDISHLI